MLSTKNMTAGSGKVKPVMDAGNQVIKINSLSLDKTPYDAEKFNITLNVETEPIDGEFEGFLKDTANPNGPRYAGQVGRIRFTPYPYANTTLDNGREIKREDEILKSMVFLSEVLGKRTELDNIQANTIEEFIASCNKIFSNSGYFNACVAGREWENKEGYTNLDLFLPRLSRTGVPLEELNAEKSRLLTFSKVDHIVELKNKKPQSTQSFEPAAVAGDDFDL